MPESIWTKLFQTSLSCPRLEGSVQADVVIIGAGFTGLAAARNLLARGRDVVILDEHEPGWGCSGRSGGLAVLRYKKNYSSIAQKYGDDVAKLLYEKIKWALDELWNVADDLPNKGSLRRSGHLTAAHNMAALSGLGQDVEWLSRVAKDRGPKLLGAHAVREGLGTEGYVGGYLDERSSVLNQREYTISWAQLLTRTGVRIFSDSRVVSVEETPAGIIARTQRGTVSAPKVIFATDGYTSRVAMRSDLYRRIIPVSSSIIATEPLTAEQLKLIIPAGWGVGDTKRLMHSMRVTEDGSLVFCGRGDITGRDSSDGAFHTLTQAMRKTFPQLVDLSITHRWSGMVAVTMDDFPHVGVEREGRILYGYGYGGRGIVISMIVGAALADLAVGGRPNLGPITQGDFRPIPFHMFRIPGMQAMAAYYGLRDGFDRLFNRGGSKRWEM